MLRQIIALIWRSVAKDTARCVIITHTQEFLCFSFFARANIVAQKTTMLREFLFCAFIILPNRFSTTKWAFKSFVGGHHQLTFKVTTKLPRSCRV